MPIVARSVLARTRQYAPVAPGTRSPAYSRPSAQTGRSRHFLIHFKAINRTEQRTLNPRVRGSSPWRRTRDDLGLYQPRVFFLCPVCPGFLGMLDPCLLGGRVLAGGRLVKNGAIGLDQPSERLPKSIRGAITAGTDPQPGCRPLPVLPAERVAPRPADSIRTLGCSSLPETAPVGP